MGKRLMRVRNSRKKDDGNSSSDWIVTYSDLVTLLLCFFVLLFSFSEIDARKFQAIVRSFQGSLGVMDGGKTIDEDQFVNSAMQSNRLFRDQQEAESMEWLYQQLGSFIQEKNLDATVILGMEERGLIIRFTDQVLFDSGKAVIKNEAREIMMSIGKILKESKKYIRVEGHTDNVPINTSKYPSNWELSTARAVNVVKFFIEDTGISPGSLSAAGYGEYHPIDPNDSSENRQKNRRVDVVILKASFVKNEPNY